MVGHPKTLYDLRKIDADLSIACLTCGRQRMIDREWLIDELLRRKKSVDWAMVAHHLRCSGNEGCGGRDVRVLPVPYAGRDTPAPVEAMLDAVRAYIEANRAADSSNLEALRAAGNAGAALHRATRGLVMWAKYGIEPKQ